MLTVSICTVPEVSIGSVIALFLILRIGCQETMLQGYLTGGTMGLQPLGTWQHLSLAVFPALQGNSSLKCWVAAGTHNF